MLRQVRAVGTAALRLPRMLRRRDCGTTQYLAERNARYPVLLVHGYAATDSVWTPPRQQDLSRWFADRHRPAGSAMFDGVPFEPGAAGCPVLADAAASFDCRLRQSHRAGDHLIVLGEVVALVHRPHLEPLIFHSGTYKSLEHESRPVGRTVTRRFGRDPGVAGQRRHGRVA